MGVVGLLVGGCVPTSLQTKRPMADALAQVEARLHSQDITLAENARRGDRVRSATYCFVGADTHGFSWNRNFAQRRSSPLPFRHVGDDADHAAVAAVCPNLFRFEVLASTAEGSTQLVVESSWWRLERGACAPHGLALAGELDCAYHYRGAPPAADVEAYVYAILKGL